VIDFATSTTLWSADGRYVVPGLALGRAVFPARAEDLAKITAEACVTYYGHSPCATPLAPVPYPDAAIRQIAGRVAAQPLLDGAVAPVSWRPDRQLVATVLPGDGSAPEMHVSLLETSTGEPAGQLNVRLQPQENDFTGGVGSLRWSPTGQQLALMDPLGVQITIWGASSLPH
jgi:hypothetical protein